jgi:hypothetical protein
MLTNKFANITTSWVEQIVPKASAVKLTGENLIRTLRNWVRTLFYWMGKPKYSPAPLEGVFEVLRLWLVTSGFRGVVLRLKVSAIVIRKFISGEKLTSTQSLGLRIRLVNGLPKWLPRQAREAIRARNVFWIRFWLTFCDLYRSLTFPWSGPDLSTITSVPLDVATIIYGQWKYFAIQFWTEFAPLKLAQANRSRSDDHLRDWLKFDLGFCLHSSSPLGRSSNSRHMDVFATMWETVSPVGFNLPLRILEWLSPPAADYMRMFIVCDGALALDWGWDFRSVPPVFSRLHFIGESAGKVRVIAIMDYWTQFIMKPIHDFLFDVLRGHSDCDATFDQTGVLDTFIKRIPSGTPFYCYDLKSATDMIPLSLSLELLSPLFGPTLCEALRLLLVERDFQVGSEPGQNIRYSRGQPMGALGSWSMMSITHHALVRFSAFRAGLDKFVDYLVLGDDLVIANTAVADAYRDVCSQFGIPIGLPKSYSSVEGFLEFARRTYLNGVDLSPISFRDYLDNSLAALVNRALKLFRGGFQPTISPLVRLCRFALTRSESSCLHDNLVVSGGVGSVLINRLCLLLVPSPSGRRLAGLLGWTPQRHLACWVDLLGGKMSILRGLCHNRVPRHVPLREQVRYVVFSLDGVVAFLKATKRPQFALHPSVDIRSPRLDSWPNRWSCCALGFQAAASYSSRGVILDLSSKQAEWTAEIKEFKRMRPRKYDWLEHFFKIFDLFVELSQLFEYPHWQSQLDLFEIAKREAANRHRKVDPTGVSSLVTLIRQFYALYSTQSYVGALSRTEIDAKIQSIRSGIRDNLPCVAKEAKLPPAPVIITPERPIVPTVSLYRAGPSGKRAPSSRFTRLR